MESLGGNIEVAGNTCGLDQANDHPNVAVIQLLLGALGNFGGPTPTYLPGPGSLAIHAVTGCPFDDQRGARRAAGACDIGAAERNAAQPATPLFTDAFEQGNTAAWD